jgi:hypothetical protein
LTLKELTEGGGRPLGRPPRATVGSEDSRGRGREGACGLCSAYVAFARGAPSAISASDRVEYAAHLVVVHGFVR